QQLWRIECAPPALSHERSVAVSLAEQAQGDAGLMLLLLDSACTTSQAIDALRMRVCLLRHCRLFPSIVDVLCVYFDDLQNATAYRQMITALKHWLFELLRSYEGTRYLLESQEALRKLFAFMRARQWFARATPQQPGAESENLAPLYWCVASAANVENYSY